MNDTFLAEAEKCIEKTGVDPHVVGTLYEDGGSKADEKVKCFIACILKGLRMMTEDGTVDAEGSKANVPSDEPHRETIIAAIDACHNEKGANECETAHAMFTCMHKKYMNDGA
ncbi:uncharacterized protein LOC107039394 isoform X2 [Diachasma alloeum]|nr:uncharacterized protein LOC107039394 isoform X2 [Diachasma alloeum]